MKNLKNLSSLLIFLSILLLGCKGDEGAVGPVGPQGEQGIAGPRGEAGSANVIYTDWKTPDWSSYYRAPDNMYARLNVNGTGEEILTKEAINSAAVFVYYKIYRPVYNQNDRKYELKVRISDKAESGYVKIPGRTTNNFDDFMTLYVSNDVLGEDYFKPYLTIYTREYNSESQSYDPIEELKDLESKDFFDLAETTPQYRIVVIPGGEESARMAAIDYGDYAAVKEAYGLED